MTAKHYTDNVSNYSILHQTLNQMWFQHIEVEAQESQIWKIPSSNLHYPICGLT